MNREIIGKIEAIFWFPLVIIYYLLLPKNIIELIKSDMRVFENPKVSLWQFAKNFAIYESFRSQVYFIRLHWRRLFFAALKPGIKCFYCFTNDIAHSMFIQHGFATVIYAKKVGHHFMINQQVTIGWGEKGCPTIGNYVQVRAGAKVIGDITIGDDVIIGANAVVTKDVPSHSMVVGVPGRIIKTRKSMEESWQRVDDIDL